MPNTLGIVNAPITCKVLVGQQRLMAYIRSLYDDKDWDMEISKWKQLGQPKQIRMFVNEPQLTR